MPTMKNKFLEPKNFFSLSELGFPAYALRVCFTKIEKSPGIVIASMPQEPSSKAREFMSIWYFWSW